MIFEKVTIVISATDENKSLIQTVETTISNCNYKDIDSFLIVIPESADEECIKAIEYLQIKYGNKIHKHIQKHPHIGGAMRDSIDETTSSHIMFLSADMPVGLECVPVMISKAKENPDEIIKISRWLEKDSFHNYNKIRKSFNWLAQIFLRVLYSSSLTDFTIPVLISPTEIYKKVNFKEWNFPCLLEAVLLPLRMKFTIKEIPAKCYSRSEGKSKNSMLQTLLYLKVALRVRFMKKEAILTDEKNRNL